MATTVNGGNNSTMFTVTENSSNVRLSTTFTITISARNRCGETGLTATASYTLSKFWCIVYILYLVRVLIVTSISKPQK